MKRRTFIWTSAAAVVTVLLPLSNCSSEPGFDEILANPITLSHINDTNTIHKLGDFYLKLTQDEAHKDNLKKKILKNIESEILSKPSNTLLIQNAIIKKIKNDFTMGKTILIDGWILSKTEARQCALFSLINN